MTKYSNNNIKAKEYADRPIVATSEDDEPEEICPSCWCNTVIKGEFNDYYCTRCKHSFNVKQEVEAADIIESESMDSHNETLVSNLPDANDTYYRKSKPEYQGAFSQLQGKGIRITSYVERDGAGRVTKSYSDGSYSSSGDPQRKLSAPRPTRFTEDRDSEDSDSE